VAENGNYGAAERNLTMTGAWASSLCTYSRTLPWPVKKPKALVDSKCYHVIITTNISVHKMVWRLEGT